MLFLLGDSVVRDNNISGEALCERRLQYNPWNVYLDGSDTLLLVRTKG